MPFEPLAGCRILDLTSVVVGPVCTARLAQYGAEVIKLESPEGDLMRGLGGQSPTGQHSGTYLHLNRGKRNICLDLKAEGAKTVVRRLVEECDIVIANMRPQALARLGLDHDTIRAEHPRTIYCLITGYGLGGPYAGFPTYDSVVQAAAGISGLMAARDGEPAYVPMVMCDHVVGEIAAGAVLAAVVERGRTGTGVFVEVPMFETMSAFVMQEHLAQHSFAPPVGPPGDQRLLNPQNKPVRTADGWVAFTVNTDKQVAAFLVATGRGELVADPRFANVAQRARHVVEWFEVRGAPLTNRTTADWLVAFRAADIAAMPCHNVESLHRDEHLAAVALFGVEEHLTEGATVTIRSSVKVDGAVQPLRESPRPRGWDNSPVLSDMGFLAQDIARLRETGAVRSWEGVQ